MKQKKVIDVIEQKQQELLTIGKDSQDTVAFITQAATHLRENNAKIKSGSQELEIIIAKAQQLNGDYMSQYTSNDALASNLEAMMSGKVVVESLTKPE